METISDQKVTWRSPSNIAITKYWGKKKPQIPCNPSISFTLDKCHTTTEIAYREGNGSIAFWFEGAENPDFAQRIKRYFASLETYMPWILQYSYSIRSFNSFPHSSGIASSASSMSALALGLCDIELKLSGEEMNSDSFLQRASFISRLGSGSAARSVFANAALWGETEIISQSSNLYAIGLMEEIHSDFQDFQDSILIVSSGQKPVSSSLGHQLMENNPYATIRYEQADINTQTLLEVLRTGDIDTFGRILETEAMQLHALMMCSTPSFVLMEPNTLEIIQEIKSFREQTKIPVYFTLDAGPNVHILYPEKYKNKVQAFVKESLLGFCESNRWIDDQVGHGPEKIE